MNTTITLRDLPMEVYERLKQAADRHCRSIDGEAIACLEQALLPLSSPLEVALQGAQKIRAALSPRTFNAEEIVDIVRANRA